MGLSCLAVPQSDATLQNYNSIHSESKYSVRIGLSCPALPKSDTVLGAKKWRMVKKLCLGIEIAHGSFI